LKARRLSYNHPVSKKFVYLVQGTEKNILKFSGLQSTSSDLLTLTYDKPIPEKDMGWSGNIFFPKSTWAEGRNRLQEEVEKWGKSYEYLIFIDDDAEIVDQISGGSMPWANSSVKKFESFLTEHKPDIGLPLSDTIKLSGRYDRQLSVHHPKAFDQIMQAYSARAVREAISIPLVTDLDKESWWASCEINQYLILNFYRGRVAQFNEFEIRNSQHSWNEGFAAPDSSYRGGMDNRIKKLCRRILNARYSSLSRISGTVFEYRLAPRERFLSQDITTKSSKISDVSAPRLAKLLLSKLWNLPSKIIGYLNRLLQIAIRIANPRYYINYLEFGYTNPNKRQENYGPLSTNNGY